MDIGVRHYERQDGQGRVVGYGAGVRWRVTLDGREYPARRGAHMVVARRWQLSRGEMVAM